MARLEYSLNGGHDPTAGMVKTLATGGVLSGEIAKVSLRGSAEQILWKRSTEGLILQPPKTWPGKFVNGFKVELK